MGSRWFSILRGAKVIEKLWPYLTEYFSTSTSSAKKFKNIIRLLVNKFTQEVLHFKLLFVVEILTPIEAIQKQLELSGPLVHEYYCLFKIKLFSQMKD